MTINPAEYNAQCYEEAPLTPTKEGKVQFLGPETVRYISPQRIEVVRQKFRPVSTHPPPSEYSVPYPPPSYQTSVYPNAVQQAPPPMVPVSMPMMTPQYVPQMVPQMAPMITQQPQMMCMPTIQQPVIAAPVMTQMSQMISPVQLSPPQFAQPQQQTSPAITLCINQSPQSNLSPGGTGGALICPKCRKGIITRKQDRFRKRLLICLAICCCPLTCGLPLLCICCNFVDTCGACGKKYGHRGKKQHKTKVNAVKL